MRLPIFQFTWGFNGSKFGLLYPLELDYDVQTFSFQIPINVKELTHRPNDSSIFRSLRENEYYFPCEIAGEYVEIEGEVNYTQYKEPIVNFNIPNYGIISFELDLYFIKSYYRKKHIPYKTINQYVGDYKSRFFEKFVFITLTTDNIELFDKFYSDKDGLFIGYTPVFGDFNFNLPQ